MQKAIQHKLPLLLCLIMVGFGFFSGNPVTENDKRDQPFAPVSLDAADSLISLMNDQERIAQLFINTVNENSELEPGGFLVADLNEIPNVVTKAKFLPFIGVNLINHQHSWLLNQSTLAKTDSLTKAAYYQSLANRLSSHGVNFVIGPSLDVYQNLDNPYTNAQSFGDDFEDVGRNAQQQIAVFKSAGITCIPGSFPGLGSTERSFERSAPLLFSKRKEFLRGDLIPFKMVINAGAQSLLMANALAPGLDSTSGELASGSVIMHQLLRKELGFKGLIWSSLAIDGRNKEIKRAAVNPLLAGSDLIVINGNLDKRVKEVNTAVEAGIISREDIDKRVKRILQSKLWLKRKKRSPKDSIELSIEQELTTRKVVEESVVLLQNTDETLPLRNLNQLKIAVFHIGHTKEPAHKWYYQRYAPADIYTTNYVDLEKTFTEYQRNQKQYNLCIIIAEGEEDLTRKRFGLSEHVQSVIERIAYTKPTVYAWQGNPNAFRNLGNLNLFKAILYADEYTPYTNDLFAQAIFGGRAINGKLHRKVNDLFERKSGLQTSKIRLAYGLPEEVGIDRSDLKQIDNIALDGIEEMAYPGCQVWFAKNGIVVKNEAYGYHQYEKEHRVDVTDLYDLASITKIAGSVAGLLQLNTQGKFSLDSTLSYYLGDLVDTTQYKSLIMREILAHQAGLTPFVPFYAKTLSKGIPRYDVYSMGPSEIYPTEVAREFYIRSDYTDQMYKEILAYPLKEKKYKYSDVGYYFALKIIEAQSGKSMDDFLNDSIYRPLGLNYMGYNPLKRFQKRQITPTEYDRIFRKQLVHGYVHDPGAAMLGGVGGHAGLFSNANDLGILMQMYLNGGSYGGKQFIDSTILADYIRCQYCDNDNRRGAGFDKPLRQSGNGPSCGCTSKEAFGHQGFTGTITWADPDEEVVYVFLSNRIYPSVNNRKLAEMNIRTDIQQAFYDAIAKSKDLAKND